MPPDSPTPPGPTLPAARDFYSMPHAYDVLHGPGTAADVTALERLAARFCRSPSRGRTWLEPACGTGRYLRVAARRGYRAIGFDLGPGMIAYAAARAERSPAARRPRFFVADMTDFDQGRRLPRVDLAFNLINTFRHLPTDRAALAHLGAVSRVLRRGGVYAVGLSLSAYDLESPSEDVWTGRRGGTSVHQVVQFLPPLGRRGDGRRAERVLSHLIIRRGGRAEEHVDSAYALRGYDLRQWRRLVRDADMEIAGVTDQAGDDAEPTEPGYFVFVLRPAST